MANQIKTKKFNKKGIVALACAGVAVLGCSLAYFTDTVNTTASGKAGTLDIEVTSNMNFLDENDQNIINPGDVRAADFNVANEGNKSADLRTKLTLTSSEAMTETGQAEYELYYANKVTNVEGVGVIPVVFDSLDYSNAVDADSVVKTADPDLVAKAVAYVNAGTVDEGMTVSATLEGRELSEDHKTITYALNDETLNGNENDAERETEKGITSDDHSYPVVMVMKAQAKNAFQDSTVSVKADVEAKQHRNTQAGWAVIDTFETGDTVSN